MVGIVNDSVGFFDDTNKDTNSIASLQISPSQPVPQTLEVTTNPIVADRSTQARMAHFEPTLYDLSDQSHLVRFMRSLLGDSGAGQLSKRYTNARLGSLLESSHFFDLDGFYGALFGASRKVDETLPINPYVDVATQDQWDDIAARDAAYRERIMGLARALPMAGTIPGLQQAAEALTGAQIEIVETWQLIDLGVVANSGRTWDQVTAVYPNWGDAEATNQTWSGMESGVTIGRAGTNNRNEVVIRVRKQYDDGDHSPQGVRDTSRRREEEAYILYRVLNRLKPAGVLLTINQDLPTTNVPLTIGSMRADSENWDLVTRTHPSPSITNSPTNPYPPVEDDGNITQVLPPLSSSNGYGWTHNGSITSVNAYALPPDDDMLPTSTQVLSNTEWEVAQPPVGSLSTALRVYAPPLAVADQRTLVAAQAAADSSLVAHPYAGASQPAYDLRVP